MSTIYRSFLQNKLWRDKTAVLLEKTGSKVDTKSLTDQEFEQELLIKLQEEMAEVVAAGSQQQLIEELADVYEVIDALCMLRRIDKETVSVKQTEKRQSRGTFTPDSFVTVAHHLPGSFAEQYCLKDPLKYPEIT